MRRSVPALGLALALGGVALAQASFAQPAFAQSTATHTPDPQTGTTPVRPSGKPAVETSVNNAASSANRTQTTGSTSQSGTVKQMNAEEKAKVEKAGK